MKRLIKNYTTDIPVERTIAEIQKILAENGAHGIALEFHEGYIKLDFGHSPRNQIAGKWQAAEGLIAGAWEAT
jgi:hypothetical protein